MSKAFVSTDDQLLARLQAPPDLSEGIESLSYWHDRRRGLSWYRIRARREAAAKIVRWERRVRDAMFSPSPAPITVGLSAGLLVARSRMLRWSRRAAIGVAAIAGVTVFIAPFVAVLLLAIHLL